MPFFVRKVLIGCGSSTVPACGGVVGSTLGVNVALGLDERLGEAVGDVLGLGESDGFGVGVITGSGVTDLVTDGDTEGVGVAEGDGDWVIDIDAEGDGFGTDMVAPLFQIFFLPDLIQVNFLLPTI